MEAEATLPVANIFVRQSPPEAFMQAQFLDLYRATIQSATDVMKASLENAERIQQQQLQLIHSALEDSSRTSSQVINAKSVDDMLELNSRLAGAQLERMTEFWSGVWRAAGDAQKLMIDQMQSQMAEAKERVRESYAFTSRASEEAARLAASQVSSAAGKIRESTTPHERKSHEQRKSA
jgi:hypothetical protein